MDSRFKLVAILEYLVAPKKGERDLFGAPTTNALCRIPSTFAGTAKGQDASWNCPLAEGLPRQTRAAVVRLIYLLHQCFFSDLIGCFCSIKRLNPLPTWRFNFVELCILET